MKFQFFKYSLFYTQQMQEKSKSNRIIFTNKNMYLNPIMQKIMLEMIREVF